jgi:hypothetical protein
VTRLIVEEALEGEVRDTLDRGYYERGDAPGQGDRNGHRTPCLKTAEGGLEYSAPPVAGLEQPFCSARRDHLKGHTRGAREPGGRDAGGGPVSARHRGRLQWQWFVWQADGTYAPLARSVAN